ncbi:MAG TPA: hypothetical protein VEA44_15520 [Caulobacter sp.]|nr:hypothetical protein [Caulobacter sp.]
MRVADYHEVVRRLLQRPVGFRLAFYEGVIVTACCTFPILLLLGIGSALKAIEPWDAVLFFAALFVGGSLAGGLANTIPLIFRWFAHQYLSRH